MLLIASVISGAVYLYRQQGFNPQKLVDNSVLQGRRFGGEVKEVAALDGKLKAYLLEDKTNPIISVDFIFKGAGAAADPSGKEGLAKFDGGDVKRRRRKLIPPNSLKKNWKIMPSASVFRLAAMILADGW